MRWLFRQTTLGMALVTSTDRPLQDYANNHIRNSHCHIAWHAGEGLAAQFLESASQIEVVDPSGAAFQQTCSNWKAYYPSKAYYLRDYAESGI